VLPGQRSVEQAERDTGAAGEVADSPSAELQQGPATTALEEDPGHKIMAFALTCPLARLTPIDENPPAGQGHGLVRWGRLA
jgi:hypothetical protein